MRISVRKMTIISLLIAQAMILGFIERSIPLNLAIPGVKLGLANIITLVSLYLFSFKETFFILVGRILLTGFMFGNPSSMIFSLAGGLFALVVMFLAKEYLEYFLSVVGISILGAVFHNFGQLLAASLVLENIKIFYYMPFLLFAGIPTGLIIGLTVRLLLKYMKGFNYEG